MPGHWQAASYDLAACLPSSRFHFTTGKFPFEGENVYKLFGVISTGVFEMPRELSPLLKDLLKGTCRQRRLGNPFGS